MSIIPKLLKSRQRFPKPEANWRFGDFSKIQPGAGANDVAGWTGETLKAGLSTVDLTQTTAAAQPVFDTDHIVFDGSDYLEGLPTQSGDFTYIIRMKTTSTDIQLILGDSSDTDSVFYSDSSSTALNWRPTSGTNHTWFLGINLSDGITRTITITRLGSACTLYVNGVSLGSRIDATSFVPDLLGNWQNNTLQYQGNIYNTLIYPTALTAAEVAAKTASLA